RRRLHRLFRLPGPRARLSRPPSRPAFLSHRDAAHGHGAMKKQRNAEPPAGGGLPGVDDATIVAILAAVAIYLSYRLALPFVPALTWALALAVVLVPVQQRLERRLGRPALAASASVAAAAILALAVLV